MSLTLSLTPRSHPFTIMPFTHRGSDPSKTPSKRKLPFPEEPPPSPPTLRNPRLQPEPIATPRLSPNPYSAEQMASIPQPRRVSPTTNSSSSSSSQPKEKLPSIRDIVPELQTINRPPPSTQSYGPDSFQPIGPTTRPAAGGLAPSPVTSTRIVPSPSSIPVSRPVAERQYASSAPAGSRESTTRNSPIQPFTTTPHRSEPARALPPLSVGFGSPEGARSNAYPPYAGSIAPSHYTSPQSIHQPYRSGPTAAPPPPGPISYGHHVAQHPSPPYTQYDNTDYASDGKSKRRRGNLPKQVTDTLRKWFSDHVAHPYPTEDEKMMLMNATNLTMSQISNWFINARRRSLPQAPRDGGEGRDGVPMGYMSERV